METPLILIELGIYRTPEEVERRAAELSVDGEYVLDADI